MFLQKKYAVWILVVSAFFLGSSVFALSASDLGSTDDIVNAVSDTLSNVLNLDDTSVQGALERFAENSSNPYCGVSIRDTNSSNNDLARHLLTFTTSVLVSEKLSPRQKNAFLQCAYGIHYWDDVLDDYKDHPSNQIQKIKNIFLSNVSKYQDKSSYEDDDNAEFQTINTNPNLYQGVIDSFQTLLNISSSDVESALQQFGSSSSEERYCGADMKSFQSADSLRNFVNLFGSILLAPIPEANRMYFFSCAFGGNENATKILQFGKRYGRKATPLLQQTIHQYILPPARQAPAHAKPVAHRHQPPFHAPPRRAPMRSRRSSPQQATVPAPEVEAREFNWPSQTQTSNPAGVNQGGVESGPVVTGQPSGGPAYGPTGPSTAGPGPAYGSGPSTAGNGPAYGSGPSTAGNGPAYGPGGTTYGPGATYGPGPSTASGPIVVTPNGPSGGTTNNNNNNVYYPAQQSSFPNYPPPPTIVIAQNGAPAKPEEETDKKDDPKVQIQVKPDTNAQTQPPQMRRPPQRRPPRRPRRPPRRPPPQRPARNLPQ